MLFGCHTHRVFKWRKRIKNTINSSSSGLVDGLNLNNATSNSSNQLSAGGNETELITFFSTTNFTNITSQVGSIVEIPCTVHNLGEGTVSWIRKKDYHLLTVGLTTYSSDERFSALHLDESEDWPLKIKYVQLRDAGIYECQVTKHPPISIFVRLNVVEARAEISGPSEKYLKPGSVLRLTCRVVENIENPLYIFWYHNNRMINYDSHRGVNVSTEPDNRYSELQISQTTTSHSGNYSCVTNNAVSSSTFVHIFNGENPAELLRDYGSTISPSPNIMLSLLLTIVTYQIFCLCAL
ncbi:CLUMA_CG017381, isoform A [Clunio marinus]|uniref:CLUMA_CG017381, isoform A n=1 Tax=Clunio marinus TaxID=568069 RepID=A0A1J1IVI8_9DIPT|nr:CLUMA_CG017381, isoform A [Clunio marinus]